MNNHGSRAIVYAVKTCRCLVESRRSVEGSTIIVMAEGRMETAQYSKRAIEHDRRIKQTGVSAPFSNTF